MASHLDEIDDLGDLGENLGRGRRAAPPLAGKSVHDDVHGQQSKARGLADEGSSGAADKVKALGINNEEMNGVKTWVTQRDEEQWQQMPQGMVAVNVSHSNLKQKMLELRFDLHQTVGEVKARLHLHHGTPLDMQRLTLRDGGVDLCALDDNEKMLGFYSVTSGMEIHVRDVDPHSISRGGALENTDLVEKFRMTEEDYDKRKGTVRDWIKTQKAADPNWKPPKPNAQAQMANNATKRNADAAATGGADIPAADAAAHIHVGDRCEVQPGGRRGSVAWVGDVPALAAGPWVGIVLDEPLGKHDGSIHGARFFQAPDGHGTFSRPKNVSVGDYPDECEDSDEEL
ncbi:CAP Gly-rich domain-containing protein [Pelagophyceae sp. CCMP2097]|nr:CAP Gly-rich domain-containing protein [Pelagophyceae sp. CCMP2097]